MLQLEPDFHHLSIRHLQTAARSSLSLLFRTLNKPSSLGLSSQGTCTSPLGGTLPESLQCLSVFTVLGNPFSDV